MINYNCQSLLLFAYEFKDWKETTPQTKYAMVHM